MPRIRPRVITTLDVEKGITRTADEGGGGGGADGKQDSYLTKIIKYIPAEAIATHQALAGFESADAAIVGWLSVALLPISVFWFYFGTKEKGESAAWSQIILCPIAFALWMLVVQSAAVKVLFSGQLLTPTQGSIVLIFATAVMPIVEKIIVWIQRRLG